MRWRPHRNLNNRKKQSAFQSQPVFTQERERMVFQHGATEAQHVTLRFREEAPYWRSGVFLATQYHSFFFFLGFLARHFEFVVVL